MITLTVKKRTSNKLGDLRKKGIIPAILYGPKIKNLNLEVDLKELEKVYKEAGETSLVSLKIEEEKKSFLVLIHDIQVNPVSGNPIHVDFYQPALKENVEAMVPVIFEGEAPVVKNLGGTLVKNISEIEVRALPQNLPKELRVDVGNLKTFEDNISVADLQVPEGVKILRKNEDVIVSISLPEKVEEELEKPIEEKTEEAKKVEEKAEEKPIEGEKEKTKAG